jgi:hypothetical protein
MRRLQIRTFGPYFNSFLTHSYSYAPANEPKSVLEPPNFRCGPHSPTGSQAADEKPAFAKAMAWQAPICGVALTLRQRRTFQVRLIPKGCGRLASGHF